MNASIAFGGICIGNAKYFLPKILEKMEKEKEDKSLYLNTLKVVINEGRTTIYKYLLEKTDFFYKQAENSD